MRPVITIIKRQFASSRIGFIITTFVVLLATTSADSAIALSNGNYTWLLAAMTPFFLVFYDYTKLIYLGAGKKSYYLASIMSY